MKPARALLMATLWLAVCSAAVPVHGQNEMPAGEWIFPSASSLPLLTITPDGSYQWGNTRGQLSRSQPQFTVVAQARYFGGIADAEGDLLLEVRGDRLSLRRAPTGAILAEATRRQSNALGIEWVSAPPIGGAQQPSPAAPSPVAPGPDAPKPPPATNNPLGIEWATANPQAPSQPAAPSPAAPKPPPATNNPLGIEWVSANAPAPGQPTTPKPDAPRPEQPKPEAPKPQEPATGNPLGIEWVSARPPEQPKPEQPKPEQPIRPQIVSLTVRPADVTIARGDSVVFEAFANYSDGSQRRLDRPYWNVPGGSISDLGVYRALNSVGTYEVRVRDLSSGRTGTASINIVNARLMNLRLEPANETRTTNWETQMKAVGVYSDGTSRAVPGVQFSATGGTITPAGLFTAATPGRYTITATDPSGVSGSTTMTIVVPEVRLHRVLLTPADTQVAAGGKVRYELIGHYSDGSVRPVSTDFQATGGTIDAAGVYTAGNAVGTYSVSAPNPIVGGMVEARVTVTRVNPVVTALQITPADTTILVGSSLRLKVAARFSDGSTRAPSTFLLTATGGSAQSSPDGTGYYTAPGSPGTYTLTASHWETGVTATATVRVVTTSSAPPKPSYSGVCRDPWVTEVITTVMGRKPQGEADTAECDYRRYGGGQWSSKAELRRHVQRAFGKPVSPVRALYVLDGTDSKYIHQNAMWHLYQQWDDHRYFQDGVNLLATNIDGAYRQAYDRICRDVKPKSQGGQGIQEVFLAGYSRGAIMSVRMADDVQSCGARVVFVGLVDAVNTNIWNWPVRVPSNVPVRVHLRKPRGWEHVLTTRDLENVTTLQHPKDVDHKGIVCKVGNMDEWRWTTDKLIEYAKSAGGTFGPALNEPTKC